MKAIKQFNGIDFPLWKKMIEGILEFLKLDYVLYTVKPFPPTSGIKDYDCDTLGVCTVVVYLLCASCA